MPRRESLLRLLNGRVVSEEKMEAMMDLKNGYYLEFIHEITPKDMLPGALELLQELRAAGICSAIGSASKNAGEVDGPGTHVLAPQDAFNVHQATGVV